MNKEKYLVSDLDGTLIPWEGMGKLGSFDSLHFLEDKMKENSVKLIILTGRSISFTMEALEEFPIPRAEMIFAFSGAALYKRAGEDWVMCPAHRAYLDSCNPRWDRSEVFSRLSEIKELEILEETHQSEYKISCYFKSLNYKPLLDRAQVLLGDLADTVSLQIYPEPVQGWCYLDMLALQSDKEGALSYLKSHEIKSPYVFAGDNWNDRTAFLSDHPAILVHNTPCELKEETRLKNPQQFIARGKFAHGVLEGLEKLGWVK